MAWIPLKQSVTVTPASSETDRYDRPVMGEPYTLKAFVMDQIKTVKSVEGDEVVSTCTIYLDKSAKITPLDVITYVDDDGRARTYTPISIATKRHLNGKPVLKVVHV